jgi:2-polyprenyl-3-methyl-5-hydroxy-6-metoxy-1,4-benzoquinol methylase
MSTIANALPEVVNQYEAMPYPPCNPEDDHKRLARTWLEDLPMINHYCFAGRQHFKGVRVLVAGGGTGDATIFLAEQLRHHGAQIVHLDLSSASIAIARRRAEIRRLDNITWVQDSLLNLPALGLGRFHYINCSGVLHHLPDPDAGLRVLRGALTEDGALGLMLYATSGRLGVYQMQQLMRLVNAGETDVRTRLENTKDMLASLPPTHWFKRGESMYYDHKLGDAGVYDLLLHSQDRSYSVGELFDWLAAPPEQGGHGLHLAFSDVQRGRAPYLPHLVLGKKPPAMTARLRALPLRRQYEIGELSCCAVITHSFYATRDAGCTAPYGDADYIPFYFHEPINGDIVSQVFLSNRGKPFMLEHEHTGVVVKVDPGRFGPQILKLIDGKRSFGAIFDIVRAGWKGSGEAPDNAALFADFAESYDTLNAIERLLLRHPSADAAAA